MEAWLSAPLEVLELGFVFSDSGVELLLVSQPSIDPDLPRKQPYFCIPLPDQACKACNHCSALSSQGSESLVLICQISAGSGVTCSLGAAGGGSADGVLQARNTGSVSSTASLQLRQFLRVVMGVFLLIAGMLQQRACFVFRGCLRLLRLHHLFS